MDEYKCLIDGTILQEKKPRKVKLKDESFVLPIYFCAKCNRYYTFLPQYDELSNFKLGNINYINIANNNTQTKYMLPCTYKIDSKNKNRIRKYIIYGSNPPGLCKNGNCNGILGTETYYYKNKRKQKQEKIYQCFKCKTYHISRKLFNSNRINFGILNTNNSDNRIECKVVGVNGPSSCSNVNCGGKLSNKYYTYPANSNSLNSSLKEICLKQCILCHQCYVNVSNYIKNREIYIITNKNEIENLTEEYFEEQERRKIKKEALKLERKQKREALKLEQKQKKDILVSELKKDEEVILPKVKCYVYNNKQKNCFDCKNSLVIEPLDYINRKGKKKLLIPKYCEKCGVYYIHKSNFEGISNPITVLGWLGENRTNINTNDNSKHINLHTDIDVKDFVVIRSTFKCMYSNHNITNINAIIKLIDKKGIIFEEKISAGYCESCNIFFIMESSFDNLKRKGTLICRITDEKTYLSNKKSSGNMKLAQQSILMQYGYNVSQTKGLSVESRRKILALLIDNEILTKSDVISYLDFFINQHKGNKYMIAVQKWSSDRDYISTYGNARYKDYRIGQLKRKTYL